MKKWSWLSREFLGSRILVELCCKCRVKGTKIRRKELYWPNDKRARGSPAQQKVPEDVFSAVTHETSVRLFSLTVEILQICKPPLRAFVIFRSGHKINQPVDSIDAIQPFCDIFSPRYLKMFKEQFCQRVFAIFGSFLLLLLLMLCTRGAQSIEL